MTDPAEPTDTPLEPSAEELGRSYDTLLESQSWEVDVGDTPAPPPVSPTEPSPPSPPSVLRLVEALLFIGGPPLTVERASAVIRNLTSAQFQETVDSLNHDYHRQGRPYTIRPQEQGYVLALRPRFRPVMEKLYGAGRTARLSPQAIDVLALVAYRQPATKQEIDSLRGAESGTLLRQLVRRGLVAIVQRANAAQREVAYGTTARFLELFGLQSLEDLPQTQDLQKL